jgi:hypothetical protein
MAETKPTNTLIEAFLEECEKTSDALLSAHFFD